MGSVRVVAAVIRRGGTFLVARRPDHKRHGGLWEFPGGKLGDGESVPDAARRELHEELGLRMIRSGSLLHVAADPGSPFVVEFHEIDAEGEPVPTEHQEARWARREELLTLALAPADAEFVRTVLCRSG